MVRLRWSEEPQPSCPYDLFPTMPTGLEPTLPLIGSTVYSVDGMVRYGDAVDVGISSIPEPSTWAMMLVGFAGLGFAGLRAWRKSGTVTV